MLNFLFMLNVSRCLTLYPRIKTRAELPKQRQQKNNKFNEQKKKTTQKRLIKGPVV